MRMARLHACIRNQVPVVTMWNRLRASDTRTGWSPVGGFPGVDGGGGGGGGDGGLPFRGNLLAAAEVPPDAPCPFMGTVLAPALAPPPPGAPCPVAWHSVQS